VFGDGRVTVGGDVAATMSCAFGQDGASEVCPAERGFFNYTDYQHSALRGLRADFTADVKATEHLSVLGEVRIENVDHLEPYALYVRIRPWLNRGFAVQLGRVPPVFGAFARRIYPSDNPLIGYPLAYQYLTSLRPDALPASPDELLRMRGRGWLSSFSIGDPTPAPGVPLVSAFRWDTGVQAHLVGDRMDVAFAVTTGTLANPLVGDDNAGRQLAGRVGLRATPGLLVGASFAHGPFVSRVAMDAATTTLTAGDLSQTAWGADLEYGRGHLLVRGEAMLSQWRVPSIPSQLSAWSASLEARQRLAPGLHVAGRIDRLTFSTITGSVGTRTWDANVTRVELGGGYALQRNLLLKLAAQHNVRAATRRVTTLAAAQVVYWF
jgi:hypothetical protein